MIAHVRFVSTLDFFSFSRSMRQNLIAMLADLFNMLEVHPVKSVKYPGTGEYNEKLNLHKLTKLYHRIAC